MPPEVAVRNGTGYISREISACSAAPLPITRRAIAGIARFLEGKSERERDHVQSYCQLADPEREALERLAENLRRCGPREGWCQASQRAAAGFVLGELPRRLLLDGLLLRARDLEAFVRALGPMPNRGTERALLSDLPAYCVDEPEERAFTGDLPPIVSGFVMEGLAERLVLLMERKGLALDEPCFSEQKIDLASLLGCKPSTVGQLLCRIRKERGIETLSRMRSRTIVRRGPESERSKASPASLPRAAAPVPACSPSPSPLPPPPAPAGEARAAAIQLVTELIEAGFEKLTLGPLETPLRRLVHCAYPELLCPP